MKKIIKHLREQPEEKRRHILHILTFFGALIMLVLWSFSLGKNLNNKEVKENIKKDVKPFLVLKDNILNIDDR